MTIGLFNSILGATYNPFPKQFPSPFPMNLLCPVTEIPYPPLFAICGLETEFPSRVKPSVP